MKRVYNHAGGVGEIGFVIGNHSVTQSGTIGEVMSDVADKSFPCRSDRELSLELGLYSYAMRVMGIVASGIIQLPLILREAHDWTIREFREIGLRHDCEAIFDDDFSVANIPELRSAPMSVFFFGEDAHIARPDRKRLKATARFNDKTYVIELAQRLGVLTPPTVNFSTVQDVDPKKLFNKGSIKLGNSVAGLGYKEYLGSCDLEEKLSLVPNGIRFQIQKFLKGAKFLSFQWFIDDYGFSWPITGTCNIIENGANHVGNWSSSEIPHKALEYFTRPMIIEAARQGIKGWVSFDVAFYRGRFYLVECNPRYTGAAYPFIPIARLLGFKKAQRSFWWGKTYIVNRDSIGQIDLGRHKYNSNTEEGWVVFNSGPIGVRDKKIGLVYTGDPLKFRRSEFELRNKILLA